MRNGKNKGKVKAPVVDPEELEARASAFARTSAVVRGALKRWVAKSSERVLYNDAVRRSDAYTGQKTKRRQEAPTQVDAEQPEVKRTARTRVRRRVSAKYVPPQTDAELARRLKEVSDKVLGAPHTANPSHAPKPPRITNSMNADGRLAPSSLRSARMWAIRLRSIIACGSRSTPRMMGRPFGSRGSSTCLTMARGFPNACFLSPSPLVQRRVRLGWSCLSVRRCMAWMTRLKGAFLFQAKRKKNWKLEIDVVSYRKYRVLDDCARLREVIETLPEDRHFIPSVLFILWNEDDSETLPDDLRHMVHFIRKYCAESCTHQRQAGDYEAKGITESYGTFSVSSKTKDLDEKFGQVLSSMELDTVGGLVEIMSRQGKSSNHLGQSASRFTTFIRVFANGHRTLEGLCLGLGDEMLLHGE